MRAMVLNAIGAPLVPERRPVPEPGRGQLLIRVGACACCRTDLHLIDGELADPKLPIVPGHQIVGVVEDRGPETFAFDKGARVGVPWLGWTCGECAFCQAGRENLCDRARFTGCHIDGGFSDYAIADERFCFPIPEGYSDAEASPLLCAGLIGYRSLRMAGEAHRIGFYGFGSAAHVIIQVARHGGHEIYAFTRDGDTKGQAFARSLGASWAGGSSAVPPEPLDAAIVFAPVGALVPAALRATAKGGTVVCAGIHMSEIPSFPYSILWHERSIRSVANLTRQDGLEFFELLRGLRIKSSVTAFDLEHANDALAALRGGKIEGTAVLQVG